MHSIVTSLKYEPTTKLQIKFKLYSEATFSGTVGNCYSVIYQLYYYILKEYGAKIPIKNTIE